MLFRSPVQATLGTPNTAILTINDTASQYRNTTPITINSGAAGSPYPSTISVAGFTGQLGGIKVTLYDISHTRPDDMEFLLVGPNGKAYVLMADVGGPFAIDPASPVTLTLADPSASSITLPDSGPLVTGQFLTTSCGTIQGFPTPAPTSGYFVPPCTTARTVEQTMFGAFGLSSPNGNWNLYVYDDNNAARPASQASPNVVSGQVAGGWGLQLLAPTAAGVSISGRVATVSGSPIYGATVSLTDAAGTVRTAITNPFGYYSFDGITSGEDYILGATARGLTFQSRLLHVTDSLTDADLTPQ